jgi:membrane fusion protein, multidrug efflux system
MLKKFAIFLLGIVVVLPIVGVVAGIKALQIRTLMAMPQQSEPPAFVSIGSVSEESWENRIAAVGSVAAFQGVVVSAEAEGTVREILFDAGSNVSAGQALVRLDTEVEQAQLQSAEAAAELAETTLTRTRELFGSSTVSKADLDAAEATVKQTRAQADNVRAVIAKKTITAPFSGRLGIRQINLGQFLTKGAAVVSLQALDPVYVEFSLPQQRLGAVSEGFTVRVKADAFIEQGFEGKITAINPEVDPITRSVRMQATLKNPDAKLRPGMFVAVEVVLPETEKVLAIPETAVIYAPYGSTVFVAVEGEAPAGADGKKPLVAELRNVRLGERRGDFVAVTVGLKAGERIVTNGGLKLRQGSLLMESSMGVTAPSLTPDLPNT